TAFLSPLGYRKKSTFVSVQSSASDLHGLANMMTEGKLIPLIDRTYNLEEIRDAHVYSESGRARGKIVIKVSD
ncbi:MAG: zinc-binding dehydrogenase, partial [Candidatus Heimdallarchaeota archaeon]|nr:zinc-binding dehydrogenase [Candidatus Heimdallarchaeota archaeon]